MEFLDYDWDDISGTFVKENILGSEFSFSTKSDLTISIDYIPKTQARKIATYAKEQLDILKNGVHIPVTDFTTTTEPQKNVVVDKPEIYETETVESFAEIMPATTNYAENFDKNQVETQENSFKNLSQDTLFEKLQNYKKLLDNGLIMQGEYDAFKKQILSFM